MNVFGSVLISISALALAGCASTDSQGTAAADGTKVAGVPKCNRVVDAPLGALMKKDCNSSSETGSRQVDKEEFLNNLQVPGSVPQR